MLRWLILVTAALGLLLGWLLLVRLERTLNVVRADTNVAQ